MGEAKRRKAFRETLAGNDDLIVSIFEEMMASDIPRDVTHDGGLIVLEIGRRGALTAAVAMQAAVAVFGAFERFPRAKIVFNIAGYDHDDRPLWDIPEVCAYAHLLVRHASFYRHIRDGAFGRVNTVLFALLLGAGRVTGQPTPDVCDVTIDPARWPGIG